MLRLPVIQGMIERRILVNYRVRADVLAPLLPAAFRPKVVEGWGMAGICLIRLAELRPAGMPRWIGVGSENAAHRAAVEWDDDGTSREGVFIWQRHTSSRFNSLAGGRLFPGVHRHARFAIQETAEHFDVGVVSDDGAVDLRVRGGLTCSWPHGSVFATLEEASDFFAAGAVGFSPSRATSRFEGLELICDEWRVEALDVDEVRSSFFDGGVLLPHGAAEFDCALLMRNAAHRWLGRGEICCAGAEVVGAAG